MRNKRRWFVRRCNINVSVSFTILFWWAYTKASRRKTKTSVFHCSTLVKLICIIFLGKLLNWQIICFFHDLSGVPSCPAILQGCISVRAQQRNRYVFVFAQASSTLTKNASPFPIISLTASGLQSSSRLTPRSDANPKPSNLNKRLSRPSELRLGSKYRFSVCSSWPLKCR